jgi:ubiquinone/menaquinone biosynthesis C-methylase UbiE
VINPRLQDEIIRIRRQYQTFEQQNLLQTQWAPFNEIEVAYRCQQSIVFASLMRHIGRTDLTGLRILDVGCGQGRNLRSYLDQGAEAGNLHGVDINESWLSTARQISPNVNFRVADGINLDFADATFDLVTQYVVFSSIALPELRQQLAIEMWRVLKPGGYVFWWDMTNMAAAAGGHDKPLVFTTLFGGASHVRLNVSSSRRPSETLRPFRGARLVAPLLDLLGKSPTHVAALIGPKLE